MEGNAVRARYGAGALSRVWGLWHSRCEVGPTLARPKGVQVALAFRLPDDLDLGPVVFPILGSVGRPVGGR